MITVLRKQKEGRAYMFPCIKLNWSVISTRCKLQRKGVGKLGRAGLSLYGARVGRESEAPLPQEETDLITTVTVTPLYI
jgi:hypothetical protein